MISTTYYWKIIVIGIIISITISCSDSKKEREKFVDLGDIELDPLLDDENFKVCHEDISIQFNYGGVGLIYEGEKIALKQHFKDKYEHQDTEGQSGYVTIRFIVNCDGKTGRFRISQMGLDLREKKFENYITDQLLDLTKSLDGWKALERDNLSLDYYQYLAFKLKDGRLIDILP